MIFYIRAVISVKTVNCEIWPLHNKLEASMFIPESPIGTDGLTRKFYDCYSLELVLLYYGL